MKYCTLGTGSPISEILPGSGASQTPRLVQIVASVGPYTFTTRNRAAHRRTAEAGHTSPPMMIVCNDGGISAGSISGRSDGGRSTCVTLAASGWCPPAGPPARSARAAPDAGVLPR